MPLDLAEYVAAGRPGEGSSWKLWIRGKVEAGGSIHDYYPPSRRKPPNTNARRVVDISH